MRASVKLRDDDRKAPLLRAKVPVSVLGLPLISGATAGDPGELALHLRTAFPGGPALKLTYHPTPLPPSSSHPFSLTLKSGVGLWGSPDRSPLLISAHFSLPSTTTHHPSFTIQLKPQVGDFTFKKLASSSPPSNPPPCPGKENGGGVHHPLPLSQPRPMGLDGLLSSGAAAAVTTTTTLPVARRAALKLRWGVNVSESAGSRWGRLPYLTVEKISIERVDEAEVKSPAKAKQGGDEDLEAMRGMCFWMRKEVEELQRENGVVKDSIEQVRRMVSDGRGSISGRGLEKEERNHIGVTSDAAAAATAASRSRGGSRSTMNNTRSSS